jgi:hypothetical protein
MVFVSSTIVSSMNNAATNKFSCAFDRTARLTGYNSSC